MTERRNLRHEPALDGLRGLAVAAVLLYHLGQVDNLGPLRNFAKGGYLGVSAFFTLSGFLITSLLIMEFESVGHIGLGGFWGRRFRRLMPAALVTLAVVGILTPILGTADQLSAVPGELWSALGYVVNWKFIASGSDYAATFRGAPSPLTHFWSLAVEEQCYFVLPFVVAIGLRFGRGNRRLVGMLFAVVVAASTMTMVVVGGGQYTNRVYMGTDTRVAELAIGALLAVAIAGKDRLGTTRLVFTTIASPLALGMIVAAWATTDLHASWLYRGGFQLHAVAVALVILAAMHPPSPLRKLLSFDPLTFIGRISYGLYLFHWPVLRFMTAARLHLSAYPTAILQVVVTFGLAIASYRFLEQPIRTRRWVVGRQRIFVPVMAVLAVALLGFALPVADRTEQSSLNASTQPVIPTTIAPAPHETAPPPPVRVIVVGDSFALSVGLGLEHWATSSGQIATLNRGLVGCGFGRGGKNRGIGLEREWPDDCKAREASLDEDIASFRPDVVLLAGGMWDVTDRQLEGSRTWTHIGEPTYDAYLLGEFEHLIDYFTTRGVRVAWATAPDWDPKYNPETFMGKPPYAESTPGRAEKYNEVLALALADRPAATSIDLAAWMNQQPGGEFDPKLRIDGVHLSLAATDTAATWLGPQLAAIGSRS